LIDKMKDLHKAVEYIQRERKNAEAVLRLTLGEEDLRLSKMRDNAAKQADLEEAYKTLTGKEMNPYSTY